MNKKISSGEMMAITIGLIATMFFGFINNRIFSISKNASLISVLIGIIIGIIPILMIMFISKKIDTNLFTFLKDKLKIFSYPIIIILTLLAIYIIFIDSWIVINFIISQFLTKDSHYFISILFSLIAALLVTKGLEITSRTAFIIFIITMVIIIFFLGFLTPYLDIENFKPIIDTKSKNILQSAIICILSTTTPLIYNLNLKYKCKDKKNFPRKIIIGYLFAMIIMFTFTFFLIGVYGIDFTKILTYPTYALFKKVQIFGFIERIENISAIIFITAYFIGFSFLLYIVKDNIKNMFKITKKTTTSIITYLISIIIPIISIYLFKTYEISYLIDYTPYILSINYIILIIIFIRCLFIKKSKTS